MTDDITALAIAWITNRTHPSWPERHLLVGAALFTVRRAFGDWSFATDSHVTTITDNPVTTLAWLGNTLPEAPQRLLLWQAEANVIPALVATAETCRDQMLAARLLSRLHGALDPDRTEVIDVAHAYGGPAATSFDAIAHRHNTPVVTLHTDALHEAHRTGCVADIAEHLVARAQGTFSLWLRGQADAHDLAAAFARWQLEPQAGTQPYA